MADELRISHCGRPFAESDVRGICGIDQSTKDVTSIGRFGIGFKSVYAFTDRPEVHSGDEDFAIENYVWPLATEAIQRSPDETIIALPLRASREIDRAEIVAGLGELGARTLLFLRHIDEISWAVPGSSGLYLRGAPEWLDAGVRRLGLIGETQRKTVEEAWLVFSRDVRDQDRLVGQVEIAFALTGTSSESAWAIQPVAESQLAVYFPTVLPTHVGFLIQGPYQTTPSRDNVPRDNDWNRRLVEETSDLLIGALHWLADRGKLEVGTLRCLPLDRGKFADSLLAPMYNAVSKALATRALFPSASGGYVAVSSARLSRTQDLRDLFQPAQLARLLGGNNASEWFSGEITADRTPELRQYLIRELEVSEDTPETIIPKMTRSFLEEQTDEWIVKLYEYLSNLPALFRQGRFRDLPVVRLEDGSHVQASVDGMLQAFLPTQSQSGFPTVRRAVSAKPEALEFLHALGLTEPDPVDDVIRNVLPRYMTETVETDTYEVDIERIIAAFDTDSKAQREKLVAELKRASFVMAVDAGNGSDFITVPEQVYLATERLKDLFSGVEGISVVDDSYDCLKGEDIREVLEACGATRYICPESMASTLTAEERYQLRRKGGFIDCTSESPINEYTLRGLKSLLERLPQLPQAEQVKRADLLWEALIELLERRGAGVFSGMYTWTYHQQRHVTFDSIFVRILNGTPWVPDAEGRLRVPGAILFSTLGWRSNAFLLSKVRFKPPIVEELARQVGIEPAVIDLLKFLGLTSVNELRARLVPDESLPIEPKSDPEVGNSTTIEANDVRPDDGEDRREDENEGQQDAPRNDSGIDPTDHRASGNTASSEERTDGVNGGSSGSASSGKRRPHNVERHFVSYVAVQQGDQKADPDGLDHVARMALERRAIELICERERNLRVMHAGNPGFDLIDEDVDGEPERWIEVKAMTGSLLERPVGLSNVQFEFARRHGSQYWLYIVEHADDDGAARIVKIQDPAGKAGTFSFDRGWLEVAQIVPCDEQRT